MVIFLTTGNYYFLNNILKSIMVIYVTYRRKKEDILPTSPMTKAPLPQENRTVK